MKYFRFPVEQDESFGPPDKGWQNSFLVVMGFLFIGMMAMLVNNQAHAEKVYEYLHANDNYEYFAGVTNVANANVRINGALGTTNSDGSFGFHVLKTDRYTINVSKIGYALVSQIEQQPNTNLNFTLKKADEILLSISDLANGIVVEDSSKTQIDLPPNAFGDVDESVKAYVYTYDLANEAMPGDMSVANRDGYLESAGVFSAEFVGTNSGKKYNLADGKEATISLPASVGGNELPGLWHYDETSGEWVEGKSESVNLVNGRLQGKVGHFSTWNFDWYKSNPACFTINGTDSFFGAYGNSVKIKAVVKNTSSRCRTGNLSNNTANSRFATLINLPPNSTVDVYVQPPKDVDGKQPPLALFKENVSIGAGSNNKNCKAVDLNGTPVASSTGSALQITGNGEGIFFSWLMQEIDKDGNILKSYGNSNTSTTKVNFMGTEMPITIPSLDGVKADTTDSNYVNVQSYHITDIGTNNASIAKKFVSEMHEYGAPEGITDIEDIITLPISGNSNTEVKYVLYVGKQGDTDPTQMCQVGSSTSCKFNPMIKLITMKQALTSIRGFVWRDDVKVDGLQGVDEKPLGGIIVKLSPSNRTTRTDKNGYYEFTGLNAGTYTVSLDSNIVRVYTTSETITRTVGSIYTDENIKIPRTANFGVKDISTVTLNTVGRGAVVASLDGYNVSCNETCSGYTVTSEANLTLNANPATGYSFVEWQGDCASTESTTSLMMDSDKTCTVVLKRNDTGTGGTGTGGTGTGGNTGTNSGNDINDNTGTVLNDVDGNGDGIKDGEQSNVVSLASHVDGTEKSVTLQASNNCPLRNVSIKQDADPSLPYGLIEFEAACAETTITTFYHDDNLTDECCNFSSISTDENTQWYTLPNTNTEIVKIGNKNAIKVSFTLKDGELGDYTDVDGKIVSISGLMLSDVVPSCAAVITYAQNPDTKECQEFATSCVTDGWNVISNEAYQACNITDKVDVSVFDPAPDDGTEPGKAIRIWRSPDVWVRNTNDDVNRYQNVKYGQDNYVYVNVRNIGTLPAQNTKVEIYRSGSSMGQAWPRGWELVGTSEISQIEPQASKIVSVKWEQNNIPKPGHYCFYVRLLNDADPMFAPETTNMVQNTRTNNNIAWRNFNVVGLLNKVTDTFEVEIGNPTDADADVEILFDEPENLLQNDGVNAIVDLGEVLFQRWQQAGGNGENIQILDGTEVKLLATPAKFFNIPLGVGENLPITMRLDAFKPILEAGTSREYNFTAQEFINNELIGGVDYNIIARAMDTDSDGDGIKDIVDDDNDNDGIPDTWEIEHGLNPLDNEDADGDLDGDGVTNKVEYEAGTDPTDPNAKPIVEPENISPTAIFSITSETGEIPLTISLDGSASNDADGTITSYKWTASDGQTAEGQNAQLTFNEAGNYTISLEVIDDKGAINSTTSNVSATAPAVGQFETSGIIRDDNGNPISGVTIKIGDREFTTNENGYWKATGLFAGEHAVIATKDGYNFRPTTCALSIGQDCQPKIKPASLLDVSITSEPRIVKQGKDITYTAKITNNGNEVATGISFIDILPVGSQLVSIEGPEGSNCDTNTVNCTLADLEAGASATINIVVSNVQANKLVNTVTLTSNEYPASIETKRSTVIPHLSVSLTDNSPATIGGNLFYIVKVKLSDLAPIAATGVKLAIQLPKGVDYQAIDNCTIDNLLIATCDIGDMAIDSETTINVTGTITDGMLLSMTARAKVDDQAEIYTHTAKKTTKILIPMSDDFKADMCVSLDITGSMGEEIGGVKIATKEFVEDHLPADQSPLMLLIVFKDNVKLGTFTRDSAAFLEAIERLQVSGGGDCPESSIKALQECATYIKNDGVIFSATDAPSHANDAELDTVINTLVGKGVEPVFMWTQGCQAQQ